MTMCAPIDWACRATAAAFAACLVVAVSVRAQEPAAPPPAAAPGGAQITLAPGPGMDTFQRVCVLCHPPDRIVTVRRTRIEWDEVLDKMITRGAQINDDNYGTLEDYLLRNYGKVNVNRAGKDDLALVLGLEPDEAQKIVAGRTPAPYPDFDALVKATGLDAKKLEGRREAMTF